MLAERVEIDFSAILFSFILTIICAHIVLDRPPEDSKHSSNNLFFYALFSSMAHFWGYTCVAMAAIGQTSICKSTCQVQFCLTEVHRSIWMTALLETDSSLTSASCLRDVEDCRTWNLF